MAPPDRFSSDYTAYPSGSRLAAVLIVLEHSGNKIRIPLIVRADNGTHHSGQIALPGGIHQEPELYPIDTALREAQEETNLPRDAVDILGYLTPLYIPVSNFSVAPVIASCRNRVTLQPDHYEVDDIRWIYLEELQNPPQYDYFLSRSAGKHIRAPYFATRAGKIWGATAMILFELSEIIRNIPEGPLQ